MDHGISSPFDLDTLRSKVDSHVEKNLERGTTDFLFFFYFKNISCSSPVLNLARRSVFAS